MASGDEESHPAEPPIGILPLPDRDCDMPDVGLMQDKSGSEVPRVEMSATGSAGSPNPTSVDISTGVRCDDQKTKPLQGRGGDGGTDPEKIAMQPTERVAAKADAEHVATTAAVVILQAAELTEEELKLWAALMFVVGAPGPVASGRLSAVTKLTKELVHRGWMVVEKLDIKALSRSFGNFDKVVALGWLLGDIVLGCLMPRINAFSIGGKASKLAPGLKSEFAGPRRKAGKVSFDDSDEGRERHAISFDLADKKEAALRQEIVKNIMLDFPSAAGCARHEAKLERASAQCKSEPVVQKEVPWHLHYVTQLQKSMEGAVISARKATTAAEEQAHAAARLGVGYRDALRAVRSAELKLALHPERAENWTTNHNMGKDGEVTDMEKYTAEVHKRIAKAELRFQAVFAVEDAADEVKRVDSELADAVAASQAADKHLLLCKTRCTKLHDEFMAAAQEREEWEYRQMVGQMIRQ